MIPDPPGRDPHRPRRDPRGGPGTGMDPMPGPPPLPGDVGDLPDPSRPGHRPAEPPDVPDGRFTLVASGREDRLHHVVDVDSGEFGDPVGLRARCGAAVEHVVPGARADRADCPGCRLDVLR